MISDVDVRQMVAADVAAVAGMCHDVIAATWPNPRSLDAMLEKNATIAGWERYLATRHCFVALRAPEIVGAAWLFVSGDVADLGGAFVRYRREGIGSRLVAARLALAERLGCSHARATVAVGNEASRENLEKSGFVVVDEDGREWTMRKALGSFGQDL